MASASVGRRARRCRFHVVAGAPPRWPGSRDARLDVAARRHRCEPRCQCGGRRSHHGRPGRGSLATARSPARLGAALAGPSTYSCRPGFMTTAVLPLQYRLMPLGKWSGHLATAQDGGTPPRSGGLWNPSAPITAFPSKTVPSWHATTPHLSPENPGQCADNACESTRAGAPGPWLDRVVRPRGESLPAGSLPAGSVRAFVSTASRRG